jgi:hypothetical protein
MSREFQSHYFFLKSSGIVLSLGSTKTRSKPTPELNGIIKTRALFC